MTTAKHSSHRVRHPLKFRILEVQRTSRLTPKMLRVILGGEELPGFISEGYDDHAKIFFPDAGQEKPTRPTLGPNGPVFPEGVGRPAARDYTPRRYDAAANELTIDFVLHGDGPGSTWASQAKPHQFLGVGGPRGSLVISNDFDWYLFAGDESALPAIARRLEELPAASQAIVIIEIADRTEEQRIQTQASVDICWLHRDDAAGASDDLLSRAVAGMKLPPGDGYVWVAAEASVAKNLRRHLVEERHLPKDRVKAAAYWKRGAVAVHETYND